MPLNELVKENGHGLVEWATKNKAEFVAYDFVSGRRWQIDQVINTLEHILEEDAIDPNRVALVGFSMGAIATWNIIVQHPNYFSAAVPIGGRAYRADEVESFGQLPIWIFNGQDDITTTAEDAKIMANAIRRAGGNVKLTLLPNAGHVPSLRKTFDHAELWPWLMQQQSTRNQSQTETLDQQTGSKPN